MRINKVKIENFKRFENLDVEIQSFDCLVGPNNSGKTTLLQALALFDFCLHLCLSGKNGQIELRPRSISPEEFYVLPVSNPVDLWTNRQTQARGKHKIIRIGITFDEGVPVTAAVDLSYNRFSVTIESSAIDQEWLRKLRQVRIAYLPVFSMFLPQEERRTPAVIEDELARGRVNSVIRNLLLNLKHESRQADLVSILRRVFPNLRDMEIEFDELNDRYISVTYHESGNSKEFDVFSAGSGFQQFIYLFGFILLRQPTVILLDEPDVHLHGTLQQALLVELQNLVALGKQILFATHSRDLIARMEPQNILAIEDHPRRLRIEFDIYDKLDEMGSVDPTQLALIQAYRRVLAIEDQSDWEIFARFCAKILGEQIWQQVERKLALCYTKGNPWKQDIARLRSQLQQMVSLENRALEMFVIGDRDYHPHLGALDATLPTEHIAWHIWQRTEIENYLLSVSAIARVANIPSDSLFARPLTDEFARLVESSRNSANDRLVKAFQEYGRSQDARWDVTTISRNAREYLDAHWASDKLALADAKDIVLPGIKRWLQNQGLGQFSNRALAAAMTPSELPEELHQVARRLAAFTEIALS